jgi:hypothetical protein
MNDARRMAETIADLERLAECEHEFVGGAETGTGGLTAKCKKCRCRFASWPGGAHYDEIAAVIRANGWETKR